MKTKSNTIAVKNSASDRHNVRGANGRFVSATAVNTKSTRSLKRDSLGRFVSSPVVVSPTKSKGTNSVRVVKPSKASVSGSSFISSMTIEGTNVNVVMSSNPSLKYTYKPTTAGLKAVNKVLSDGGSLGTAYNQHLKGREVGRWQKVVSK
jgi:hypothetical protein